MRLPFGRRENFHGGAALRGGPCLLGFVFDEGLQARQVVSRPLRMSGGSEDCPLVVLQDFEPALNVGSVVGARLGHQGKIGTKERRAQFCHQFFFGIARVTPDLAAKLTVKAAFVLGPVGEFKGKGCILSLRAAERLEHRHLHMIGSAAIVRAVAAMADVCACCSKESIGVVDPLRGINHGVGLGIVVLGQAQAQRAEWQRQLKDA